MIGEQAFLRAISACPDDLDLRLVYADWLEDRGDQRSEFVRLQAHLAALAPDDPACRSLKAREEGLRRRVPPCWAARLDMPVWCLASAVSAEHPGGAVRQMGRRNASCFRTHAKVYLAETQHCWAVLDPGNNPITVIQVVGPDRNSGQWVLGSIGMQDTTRWQVQRVRHQRPRRRLQEANWPGFLLAPNEFTSPDDRESAVTIRAFLEAVLAALFRQRIRQGRSDWFRE
jgi:uncharacterized protein (TIGR02996 family)